MARNDNNAQLIELCRERLRAFSLVHERLDRVSLACANYYRGKQLRSERKIEEGSLLRADSRKDPISATSTNYIAPLVRQYDGRLRVDDWWTAYEPADHSPEAYEAARICNAWDRNWEPFSRQGSWYNTLSFWRLLQPSSIGTWYFDESSPGGMRLEHVVGNRLTLDPMNIDWDLDNHEFAIDAQVWSVGRAMKCLGHLLPKGRELKSEKTVGQLAVRESYLGSSLVGSWVGASESREKGVVVLRMFDAFWTKLTVIILNPWPSDQKNAKEVVPDWHVVWEGKWNYENPFLKLDCFRNVAMAFGVPLALELIPTQNIVNLAQVTQLKRFVYAPGWFWFAMADSVRNKDVLESNASGRVIEIERRFAEPGSWPKLAEVPKFDGSSSPLIADAIEHMRQTSSVTATLQGQGMGERTAARVYEYLASQGIVPIDAISRTDQDRLQRFKNRVARAAVERYGRTDPGKFVSFVGKEWASKTMAGVASRTVLHGPTRCRLKNSAFRPLSTEEKSAQMFALLQAGRYAGREEQFEEDLFRITGHPARAGQAEEYQEAYEMARRLLLGQPVIIRVNDPHDSIIWVCQQFLNQRLVQDFKPEQVLALEICMDDCETMKHLKAVRRSAQDMLTAGKTAPTTAVQAGSGAGQPSVPSGSGSPAVGELVPMAG